MQGNVPPLGPGYVKGTVLPTTPNTQASGPPSFSTTAALPPIPGVAGAPGGALGENALLTSTVYHMGRIANPDINPKPVTMDGVRRNDEIHVYVARFFENGTVARCPGLVGKQLANGLKSPNERPRQLYEAYKIPDGSPNRLRIGAACVTWGGRSKAGDWVITEAEFRSWAPRDFDKSSPRKGGPSRIDPGRHNA